MLVFRILATVLVGISFITGLLKNLVMFCGRKDTEPALGVCIGFSVWSIIWRAFVIVAIWIV